MLHTRAWFVFFLLLFTQVPAKSYTDPLDLGVIKDAFVANFDPDTNFGLDGSVLIREVSTDLAFGLFAFDISAIPDNIPLALATLNLPTAPDALGSGLMVQVQVLGAPFDEFTVTFNNLPPGTGQFTTGTLGPANSLDVIDVTNLVQAAVDGGAAELGFVVAYTGNPQPIPDHVWHAKESGNGGVLHVEFEKEVPLLGFQTGSAARLRNTDFNTTGTAGHFNIFVPDESPEDVEVDQLDVAFTGTGRYGTSTLTAKLWLDSNSDGLVNGSDSLKDTKSFTPAMAKGAANLRFDPDTVIMIGEAKDFIVELTLNDKACPGATFETTGTMVAGDGATTMIEADKVKPNPPHWGGNLEVKGGMIAVDSGDDQDAEEGSAFTDPLVVMVTDRSIDAACGKVSWSVMGPAGGDLQLSATETVIDSGGMSEITATAGAVPGEYKVIARVRTDSTALTSTEFTLTVVGLSVIAQHDGLAGVNVGTFIPGIEAMNDFTATAKLGMGAIPDDIRFDLNGLVKIGNPTNSETATATFDMGQLSGGSNNMMAVEARDGGIPRATEMFNLEAIDIPGWFTLPGLNKSWDSSSKTYELNFSLPAANAFDFPGFEIPSVVELLGGSNNDIDGEFFGQATFDIMRNTSFTAGGMYALEVFGKDAEIGASISGEFDPDFNFMGGEGTLRASIEFPLPEVGASRTVLVYGVPVTLAVDLGGTVTVAVSGKVILTKDVEVSRIDVKPSITLQVDLTLSASLFFGVAKLAFIAHPTATVAFDASWRANRGTSGRFTGSFVIPYEIVGSIFWGTVEGTLFEGTFGPWSFGSQKQEAATPTNLRRGAMADFFGSGSLFRMSGDLWLISVRNTGGASPVPELFSQVNDGTGWTAPEAITSAAIDHWEMDPVARALPADGSSGKVLAVWVSNEADPALANDPEATLGDILSGQEINASLFDGASWSEPENLTVDRAADGTPALATHATAEEALTVWLSDPDGTPALPAAIDGTEIESRTDWELRWSHFTAAAWTNPETLAKTIPSSAVREPKLEYQPGTARALLVYSRDIDGLPDTIDDADIRVAWWTGTAFEAAATISDESIALGEDSPQVGFLSNGDAVVVWHGRRVPLGGTDPVAEALFARLWDDSASSWGAVVELVASDQFVEDPRIVVKADDEVLLFYRGFDDYDGDLFELTLDLDSLSGQGKGSASASRQLTNDVLADWNLAVAAGDIPTLLWNRNDWIGGSDQSAAGLDGGLTVGTPVPGGQLTNRKARVDQINEDGDDLIDALRFEVCNLAIAEAGDYALQAELTGIDPEDPARTQTIALVRGDFVTLVPGTHCLTVEVPGPVIQNHGLEGPFQFAPIQLMLQRPGEAALAADIDARGVPTTALSPDAFEQGSLSWDQDLYIGIAETARLTLDYAPGNGDPNQIDTIAVQVVSNEDPVGIELDLIETGIATGIFSAEMGFNKALDRTTVLAVSPGDPLAATVFLAGGDQPFVAVTKWLDQLLPECADTNGSGDIEVRDLLTLLADLNTDNPTYDFDNDGLVDLADLRAMILCWNDPL